MVRSARLPRKPKLNDGFRMRGLEVTRLEGFSDAVFGFALTLLVVSLDVPKTFADLLTTMRGFPAFAVCFTLLVLVWNAHYNFCRRYGLQDTTARVLTCILLFLVLFYVYPLKFLFSASFSISFYGRELNDAIHMTGRELSLLLTIYGLGFAGVYLALALLYRHAYSMRDEIGLSELERLDTRFFMARFFGMVVVGLLASATAQIRGIFTYAGLFYLVLFPYLRLQRWLHLRRRAPLLAAELSTR